MKYYIGIDIGKQGFITVQNNEDTTITRFPMPLIGNELDLSSLISFLSKYQETDHIVGFEDLRAIYGSSAGSTFSFGFVAGATEAVVASLRLAFVKIHSKTWQKEMFQGIPEIRKADTKDKNGKIRRGTIDTKPMSILASKRLFPNESLLRTSRCKVPDNNLSDALLISTYLKRHY